LPQQAGPKELLMRLSARPFLFLALMVGAVACGGAPTTVRQRTGAATSDKPTQTTPVSEARINTVEVEALEPFFPSIPGWERGEIQGQKSIESVSVTEAHVEYHRGQAQVDASITDSGVNKSYVAAFTLFVTQGYKKETPTGFERAVKVEDYPAWERWNGDAKNGELNVLVAGRFVVQLDGMEIENTKILHELLQEFDLKKIGQVK
jgi:hypothetical protein